MKNNTLILNTEDKFLLQELSNDGIFTTIRELDLHKDQIVHFKYDEITGKIYYTTKNLTINCISKDFQKSSEICSCKIHNIQFVGGYNSLFYIDPNGHVSSINIINLMPNRRKFAVSGGVWEKRLLIFL